MKYTLRPACNSIGIASLMPGQRRRTHLGPSGRGLTSTTNQDGQAIHGAVNLGRNRIQGCISSRVGGGGRQGSTSITNGSFDVG